MFSERNGSLGKQRLTTAQESCLIVKACCKGLASSGEIRLKLSCLICALNII